MLIRTRCDGRLPELNTVTANAVSSNSTSSTAIRVTHGGVLKGLRLGLSTPRRIGAPVFRIVDRLYSVRFSISCVQSSSFTELCYRYCELKNHSAGFTPDIDHTSSLGVK